MPTFTPLDINRLIIFGLGYHTEPFNVQCLSQEGVIHVVYNLNGAFVKSNVQHAGHGGSRGWSSGCEHTCLFWSAGTHSSGVELHSEELLILSFILFYSKRIYMETMGS